VSWPWRQRAEETLMAVIDVAIQPDGRTRVWFDCRAKPHPEDEKRIAQMLASAMADGSAAELKQAN
jgi:hypothetical protein